MSWLSNNLLINYVNILYFNPSVVCMDDYLFKIFLGVPLFDCSGTLLDKKNKRILNHCLSQMQCVKFFLEDLHKAYGVHIINGK